MAQEKEKKVKLTGSAIASEIIDDFADTIKEGHAEKVKEPVEPEETEKEELVSSFKKKKPELSPVKEESETMEVKAVSGIVHIERQYKVVKEDKEFATEVLKLPVTRFVTTPAKVAVKYGVTLNMGNYESARVDVMVEVPCYKEDIDEVYQMIADYTEELVTEHIEQIKKGSSGEATEASEPW